MGLGNITDEPEEQSADNDQSNSKTQLVFWKYGEPKGYEGDEAEFIQQAYQLCNGSGWLRNTLDATSAYEDVHSLAAELMVGVTEALKNDSYQPILETIGPDADAIEEYLENNPEVAEELTGGNEQTAE